MTASVFACAALALAIAPAAFAMQQPAPAPKAAPGQPDSRTSSNQPMKISLNELQANAAKYAGKQVTVEAEVQDVLGPRLLTIGRREAQKPGGLLVFIRAPFAGLVSERSRVMVTGTVQPLVRAEIDRELQWVDSDTAKLEVEFDKDPMLVATSIRSDMGVELTSRVIALDTSAKDNADQPMPRGTTGSTPDARGTTGAPPPAGRQPAISSVSEIARAADTKLVGRDVNLTNVRIERAADQRSFWVTGAQGQDNLLVVPADPAKVKVTEGQSVNISGVILQMPKAWKDKFSTIQGTDEEVYVFASEVKPGR